MAPTWLSGVKAVAQSVAGALPALMLVISLLGWPVTKAGAPTHTPTGSSISPRCWWAYRGKRRALSRWQDAMQQWSAERGHRLHHWPDVRRRSPSRLNGER